MERKSLEEETGRSDERQLYYNYSNRSRNPRESASRNRADNLRFSHPCLWSPVLLRFAHPRYFRLWLCFWFIFI